MVGFMKLKEWVVEQTTMGNFACYERVYEHMSGVLGVGKPSIRQWVDGQRRISAEHVLGIEKITNGEVTRQQLRADLYPD
jgi:DNA-binding transcriptional regulator YdaS (Cro superfamily)